MSRVVLAVNISKYGKGKCVQVYGEIKLIFHTRLLAIYVCCLK